MIIDKFKLFEQAIEGNAEHLDEGILSSITNFLSRTFGGSVSKLDSILSRYEDAQSDYWKDFVEAQDKLTKAEALLKQKISDSEKSKQEEISKRSKLLLQQIENRKRSLEESLTKQAKSIVGTNKRLEDYWDMNKAKTDEETAKSSFNAFKKIADDERINSLFVDVIKKAEQDRKNAESSYKKHADFVSANYVGGKPATYSMVLFDINVKDVLYTGLTTILKNKLAELSDDELKKFSDALKVKARAEKTFRRETGGRGNSSINSIANNERDILDYVDYLMTSDDVVRAVKSEKGMETELTKDVLSAQGTEPDEVIQNAIDNSSRPIRPENVARDITDQVKSNFEHSKEQVEFSVGTSITDEHYKHLLNDMIALYGKLALYYNEAGAPKTERVLTHDIIDFASVLYKQKSKMNKLGYDLNKKELEKIFDDYDK